MATQGTGTVPIVSAHFHSMYIGPSAAICLSATIMKMMSRISL